VCCLGNSAPATAVHGRPASQERQQHGQVTAGPERVHGAGAVAASEAFAGLLTSPIYFNPLIILVIESSQAASRSSAFPTRAISAGTFSYSPCSIASRTPGIVLTL
jgi:hypothetical protein